MVGALNLSFLLVQQTAIHLSCGLPPSQTTFYCSSIFKASAVPEDLFKIKYLDSWRLPVRKTKARDGEGELVPKAIVYVQEEPNLICITLEPRWPFEMLNF